MLEDAGHFDEINADAAAWCDGAVRAETTDSRITCLNRALAIDPNYALALIYKAAVLREADRSEEAIACCNRAFSLDPGCFDGLRRELVASLWRNKALALHDLWQLDQESAFYDEILKQDLPVNERAEIWGLKGAVRICMRQIRDAVPCFEEAERLGHPDGTEAIRLCQEHLRK